MLTFRIEKEHVHGMCSSCNWRNTNTKVFIGTCNLWALASGPETPCLIHPLIFDLPLSALFLVSNVQRCGLVIVSFFCKCTCESYLSSYWIIDFYLTYFILNTDDKFDASKFLIVFNFSRLYWCFEFEWWYVSFFLFPVYLKLQLYFSNPLHQMIILIMSSMFLLS